MIKLLPIVVFALLLSFCAPLSVYASAGSHEFCEGNPGHFACDGKIGQEQDDNEDDPDYGEERECENPPDAASCNNDTDARGVSTTDGVDVNKWEQSCYNGGFRDGQGEPFENEAYKECGDYGDGADRYYDGFISGCMSVQGNSRDVCESATDT